jgi:hypothetical protein
MRTTSAAQPPAGNARARAELTERQFQQRIIDLARLAGWHVVHYRPAWSNRGWVTALVGDKGCPDLILARRGQVILAELKTDKGSPIPEQRAWLAALGEHGRLWRPRDWDTIATELTSRQV